MALPGERFEIASSDENPFSAVVATDEEYRLGRVRIEPPFTISEKFLEDISTSDIGVELIHEVSTGYATLLHFSAVEIGERDAREAVEYTVQVLLAQLGATASEALFLSEYDIKAQER